MSNTTINGHEILYTATQVAGLCGVTSSAINDAAKAGKIHAVNEPGDGIRVVRRFKATEAHRYASEFLAKRDEQAAKAKAKADRIEQARAARLANVAKATAQIEQAAEARRLHPPMRLTTPLDAALTERQRGSLYSLLEEQRKTNALLEKLVSLWGAQ